MTDSGEMLVQMWLGVKPYIDKKERDVAAVSFLRGAEDFLDLEEARSEAKGTDAAIDNAFAEILGELDEDHNEEDDEEE